LNGRAGGNRHCQGLHEMVGVLRISVRWNGYAIREEEQWGHWNFTRHVIARNQDDHTKNIAFLMDLDGKWHLSPAYDVTYSHNPAGIWTNQHQMSINGKRDHFSIDDLIVVGKNISLPKPIQIIKEVKEAVQNWPRFASKAGLNKEISDEIGRNHRFRDKSI